MKRVSVVGTVGSGKTTFARALARRLDVPFIELDALHWGPDWAEASEAEMRDRVSQVIAADSWVIDGNYWRKIGGMVWERADTVVWLDPPWRTTFLRVLARTVRRALRRTELFNGNRETFQEAFLSPKSILLFSIRTGRHRRRIGEERLARPEFRRLAVLRLRSPAEAEHWLASVPAASGPERVTDAS